MLSWPVQDAKARFSEFLDTCVIEGPQVVTRRGIETAVLVPIDEWRLQVAARPSLKQVLLTDSARTDQLVPARGKSRRRHTIQGLCGLLCRACCRLWRVTNQQASAPEAEFSRHNPGRRKPGYHIPYKQFF